jgi:hypothetical protein
MFTISISRLTMSEEQPRSARTEILPANHRKNSSIEQKRSSPLRSVRPAGNTHFYYIKQKPDVS